MDWPDPPRHAAAEVFDVAALDQPAQQHESSIRYEEQVGRAGGASAGMGRVYPPPLNPGGGLGGASAGKVYVSPL